MGTKVLVVAHTNFHRRQSRPRVKSCLRGCGGVAHAVLWGRARGLPRLLWSLFPGLARSLRCCRRCCCCWLLVAGCWLLLLPLLLPPLLLLAVVT